MNYLLVAVSAFAGSMGAIVVFTTVQRIKRAHALRELQIELLGRLETEMTFAQMAMRLRQDMGMLDD
jgi:hypothetical protein